MSTPTRRRPPRGGDPGRTGPIRLRYPLFASDRAAIEGLAAWRLKAEVKRQRVLAEQQCAILVPRVDLIQRVRKGTL